MNRRDHLLTIAQEECAEVIQAAAKALRFGLQDGYPGTNRTNARDLTKEFADVFGIYEMLVAEGHIPRVTDSAVQRKKERVEEYLIYSKSVGRLTEEP